MSWEFRARFINLSTITPLRALHPAYRRLRGGKVAVEKVGHGCGNICDAAFGGADRIEGCKRDYRTGLPSLDRFTARRPSDLSGSSGHGGMPLGIRARTQLSAI
jgi:hypothetical protein